MHIYPKIRRTYLYCISVGRICIIMYLLCIVVHLSSRIITLKHNYAKYAYFRIMYYSESSDFLSIVIILNLPLPVTAHAPVTEVATA